MRHAQIELKSGQIAAILGLDLKQIQNTVDAGYIRPAIKAHGRGQLRLYSFEKLIQFKVLHTLVQAYGLEKQAAAKMLKRAWPRPFTPQVKTLELRPVPASQDRHLPLEPIRVPLGDIIASTQARAEKTLRQYQEKKRGRPVGWKKEITAALEEVSVALQEVDDTALQQAILATRAARKAGAIATQKA